MYQLLWLWEGTGYVNSETVSWRSNHGLYCLCLDHLSLSFGDCKHMLRCIELRWKHDCLLSHAICPNTLVQQSQFVHPATGRDQAYCNVTIWSCWAGAEFAAEIWNCRLYNLKTHFPPRDLLHEPAPAPKVAQTLQPFFWTASAASSALCRVWKLLALGCKCLWQGKNDKTNCHNFSLPQQADFAKPQLCSGINEKIWRVKCFYLKPKL